MLPPIASGWFGALLAGSVSLRLVALHSVAVFTALYTAHVKDGYVDFYERSEDDDHPLSKFGCRFALVWATAVFFTALATLVVVVDLWAGLLTLPGWIIGFLHAPQFDTNPVTATAGYPSGIAFALLGGYYVQAGTLSTTVLGFAVVFLVVLSGIKVIDDAKDYAYDRSIAKRTVAVVLGPTRAFAVAYMLMAVGLVAVGGLSLTTPVFPRSAVLAPPVFALVALLARDASPKLATKLLIRGSYLFLAALVIAVWYRPIG
jgi:4-hydroxybenzoate polyprenyltransferase